jgi:hypothetical protein
LEHQAHGASCQRQFSQGFRQEIPWGIVILALESRPFSTSKNKGNNYLD